MYVSIHVPVFIQIGTEYRRQNPHSLILKRLGKRESFSSSEKSSGFQVPYTVLWGMIGN